MTAVQQFCVGRSDEELYEIAIGPIGSESQSLAKDVACQCSAALDVLAARKAASIIVRVIAQTNWGMVCERAIDCVLQVGGDMDLRSLVALLYKLFWERGGIWLTRFSAAANVCLERGIQLDDIFSTEEVEKMRSICDRFEVPLVAA
jgi:hypothetical protein